MSQPAEWTSEWLEPVTRWLDALSDKERARVLRAIDLLRTYGAQLRMPYARHLRGKLWELRIPAGKRDYRVLYFAATGRRFILLHAFSKQTDKTPAREIAIAERRMAEYLADPERDEP